MLVLRWKQGIIEMVDVFLVKASQEMRNRITGITSRLHSVVQRIDRNLLTKQLHGKR